MGLDQEANAPSSIQLTTKPPTWDAMHLNAALLQVLKLFAASAKYIRVATFQPHHSRVFMCKLAQQLMNFVLCPGVKGTLLAHIDHPGPTVYELQNICRNKPASRS